MRKTTLPINPDELRDNADSGAELLGDDARWLALVAEKVKNLRFGQVQIVVHDSRVVQVERTERHRFDVNREA